MKKASYSVRINEIEKKRLEKLAKDHDLSLTALLTTGASLYGAFPRDFFKEIEIASRKTGLSVETIIVHCLLDLIASQSAWLEVFGKAPQGIMRPFKWEDGKLVTGDKLLDTLKSEYIEEYQRR